MKISQFQIVLFFVFIIYPFAALPLIFVEIYNKKYYALNYLAVFMGLLGYLWIPSGDLSRWQSEYLILKDLSFENFLSIRSLDFVTNYIMFFFGKLNLNFEFVRFTLCIISYLIYFKIYLDIIKENKDLGESKRYSFLAFLMFFFFLRFTGFLTGVRFTFAMSFCFYGVYRVIYKDDKKGWFLLLFSAFTHFSMWLIVFIAILVKLISIKINRTMFVLFIITGLFLSTTLVQILINLLPLDDAIKGYLKAYTDGYFAKEEYLSHSLLFRISKLLSYCALYPAVIYILYKKNYFSFFSIFIIIVIFLSFMTGMDSVYARYAFLGVIFFVMAFLLKFKKGFENYAFYFFFFLSFLTYSTSFYSLKRELEFGNQYRILFSPLPLVFFSTYDAKWIESNIYDDGSIKGAAD